MVRAWCALMVLGCGAASGSEPPRACFASIAEAATQTRALDPSNVNPSAGEGFRLESLRRDRLMNKRWAIVSSCDHPERPAVTVALGAAAGGPETERPESGTEPARQGMPALLPVVRAGARVRLVGSDPHVRFETTGFVEQNGAVGENVRVRLAAADGTQPARVVMARVRTADLLELEF